ncbi:MAG: hypothetical protein JRG89_06145 [Deltaproteobacteria bacterium]|nr:hypothetical protein [Deltaproteobacteria bacterium]MBW2388002.1 hypothetical protein [Deltaproteobacteria bacterium]
MNPALGYLLLHRPLGALRRFRRRVATPRGAILALGLVMLLGLILGSPFLANTANTGENAAAGMARRDQILLFAPPALLFIALIGIRAGAFYFKPAEIQFLLPAPVPRRQLLMYNIASRLQIAFLSAIWISVFTLRYASTWVGGFVAIFALLSFNQLTAQLGGIVVAASRSRADARPIRWSRWVVAAVFALAAIAYTLPPLPSEMAEAARLLAAHPFIHSVSWLTRPFVELFLSDASLQMALWGGATASILLIEIALMLRLDGAYLEGLTNNSDSTTKKRQRRMHLISGSDRADSQLGRLGIRIPILLFPGLRGAGPIAWRQCQELVRNPASLLRGGLGLLAVIPIVIFRASTNEDEGGLEMFSVMATLLMIPMMIDGADFRRDLDRIPILKSLPLRTGDVALGQILPTALLLSFWMMVGGLLIFGGFGQLNFSAVYLLVVLIPPIALIIAAVDNWLFLLMPYRIRTRDPGESTFVGRLTIVMTVKMFVLIISLGLGFGAVIFIWKHVAESVVLAGFGASVMLSLCCIPAVGAVARAFGKFDVADGPPE